MVEKIITDEDKQYGKYLELLTKKYENLVTQSRNDVFTLLGWLVTLLIAYLVYKFPVISNLISTFLNGDGILKVILLCVLFTTAYLTNKVVTWILQLEPIRKRVQKIFGVSYFLSNIEKLNKLYLAVLEPNNWQLIVIVDEEKGIFELKELNKIKK